VFGGGYSSMVTRTLISSLVENAISEALVGARIGFSGVIRRWGIVETGSAHLK
jgi:hypothetical protein